MIYLKTRDEIESIRESCLIVCKTLARVAKHIRPGITTIELDKLAETFIYNNGGRPAFLGYDGFPNSLCISINDVVVHGIPSMHSIKEGDVVSVDCGVEKEGYYGDACYTFLVGQVNDEKRMLCKTTKEALYKGIDKATEGNRVGAIGNAIQSHAEDAGYSVVKEMTGHGIGRNLHEDPEIRNYGRSWNGKKLISGMVLAIEPMINAGKRKIYQLNDGWTIKTLDGRPSAHYEHTIAVGFERAEILSDFNLIENEIKKNKYLWQNSLQ
jgi:methionyl aminopeptidase